jgi:DnaJ-class molecular chaperone
MSNKPQDQGASDQTKLNPGDQAEPGTPGAGENICPECKGTGRIGAAACPICDGTGKIIEGIGGG